MNILISTIKPWNITNAERFKERYQGIHNVRIITDEKQLNLEILDEWRPDIIFFPHWSYIIPDDIYEKYLCIVFHMTDLPYGRGGSPLQNLIVRGHRETKISAIKVQKEVDAGPVYMKEKVSLEGSASEIFERVSEIVFEKMMPVFLQGNIEPVAQQGRPTYFKRRKPEDSEIKPGMNLTEMYDHIRMLDADGYPHAFLDSGTNRILFRNARMVNGKLSADVVITEKEI